MFLLVLNISLCVLQQRCVSNLSNVMIRDNAVSRLAEMVAMTMLANSFSELGTLSLLSSPRGKEPFGNWGTERSLFLGHRFADIDQKIELM